MTTAETDVIKGQRIYTPWVLAFYDFLVLGLSNRFLWNCPTPRLETHYHRHLTANHLEVGVGTGYLLDHCRFPTQTPRLALMDLNATPLAFTARRLARYRPETYRRNVLEPITIDAGTFDSVGINYVLHCLPGSIESKAAALDHLAALMNPHGVLFGSTLLQDGVPRNWLARWQMAFYNRTGIFSNRQDDLAGLERALCRRLRDVSIEVVGCAALFSGRL